MKKENVNNKDLRIGLIGLLAALVILFIIGLFVFRPEPITIQGEADATEVRISGKVPGRIKLFLTEEGAKVHAQEFLKEGCKVKAYVFFKGRSILFKEQGEVLLLRFASDLEELAKVDSLPTLEGKRMIIMFSPKKPSK